MCPIAHQIDCYPQYIEFTHLADHKQSWSLPFIELHEWPFPVQPMPLWMVLVHADRSLPIFWLSTELFVLQFGYIQDRFMK